MKFRTFREYGALNSPPVFDAVEQGLKSCGHQISKDIDAIPVIWSVLWNGRMSLNQKIYEDARNQNKFILILEVGNFLRNKTWRVSLNHINREGIFGNTENLDLERPKILGLNPRSFNEKRKSEILIACQHQKSLQWKNMPGINQWLDQTIQEIRKFSDREIVIRPHPRSSLHFSQKNVKIEIPKKINTTYDDFDIDYSYHCVINHNSGVPIQAVLNGTPVICHESSLAFPVSMKYSDIEKPFIPDTSRWLTEISHTEWFLDEIKQGIPFKRLEKFF